MLSESRGIAEIAPWLMIFPALSIIFAVMGFNLLGDGLRDVLDPRLRGRKL
jgi:peptide/nickel transport system permease protein